MIGEGANSCIDEQLLLIAVGFIHFCIVYAIFHFSAKCALSKYTTVQMFKRGILINKKESKICSL
jgi:hypothetical protein